MECSAVIATDYGQHRRLEQLTEAAVPSAQPWDDPEGLKITLAVDASLMWEILDYTCERPSLENSGRGIFHPSLSRPTEQPEPEQYLRVRIFHRPRLQVDLSSGGQERPPFAELSPRTVQSRVQGPLHARQPQHPSTVYVANVAEDFPYQDPNQASNQDLYMWLGSEDLRRGLFADMDLEMSSDNNLNAWNFGTL